MENRKAVKTKIIINKCTDNYDGKMMIVMGGMKNT
jgi:hypothetical protein